MRLFNRRRAWVLAVALTAGLVGVPAVAAAEPAAAEADSVHAARTKLFGAGWDNPGVVRIRPAVGNTTSIVSFGGTVILNDSTIEDDLTDVGDEADNNGFVSLQDVIAAKPDAILQNHTHFDQQHHAPEIAASGVPLVTDLLGCFWTKETAIEKGIDPAKIECNLIRDAEGNPFVAEDSWFFTGATPIRDVVPFTQYGTKGWPTRDIPGIDAMAIQLKHSSPLFVNRGGLSGPQLDPVGSAQDLADSYQNAPEEIPDDIVDTFQPFDAEGANLGFMVRYKDFSLFNHGSTGPSEASVLGSAEPGVEEIDAALRSLREEGRVDLEMGGVAELTYFTNGAGSQNNQQYSKDIGAKMFMPIHHFNWWPTYFQTQPAATWFPEMTEAWAASTEQAEAEGFPFPEMCFHTEDNYATVYGFDVSEWEGDDMGKLNVVEGPGCYQPEAVPGELGE